MADTPARSATSNHPPLTPQTPWTGTGLCCESQGDGVPCSGPDGECETCGRALAPAEGGAMRTDPAPPR